jgi:hypothetical protein
MTDDNPTSKWRAAGQRHPVPTDQTRSGKRCAFAGWPRARLGWRRSRPGRRGLVCYRRGRRASRLAACRPCRRAPALKGIWILWHLPPPASRSEADRSGEALRLVLTCRRPPAPCCGRRAFPFCSAPRTALSSVPCWRCAALRTVPGPCCPRSCWPPRQPQTAVTRSRPRGHFPARAPRWPRPWRRLRRSTLLIRSPDSAWHCLPGCATQPPEAAGPPARPLRRARAVCTSCSRSQADHGRGRPRGPASSGVR